MKRTVFAFCVIALLTCLILPWNAQAEATVCPYCGRSESEYIELTNDLDRFLVAGHYYMKGDVTRSKQLVLEAEGISCLDLAGHTLLGPKQKNNKANSASDANKEIKYKTHDPPKRTPLLFTHIPFPVFGKMCA